MNETSQEPVLPLRFIPLHFVRIVVGVILVADFNDCRNHMPLKETPTMASGDHIWTIPELIEVSAKLCHLGLKPNGPGDMLGFVRFKEDCFGGHL